MFTLKTKWCIKPSKVPLTLKGSPDSLMWFCQSYLTAFPGVKKVMVKLSSLKDKYEKLDERVKKLETRPKSIDNISDIVPDEVRELQDIEMRRLHMVCFNLPESENLDPDERKHKDEERPKSLIDDDMKLSDKNIIVNNPIRLGKKMYVDPQSNVCSSINPSSKEGTCLLRFKVDRYEDKRMILQANAELKNGDGNNLSKIFLTPDQTRRQREESFKLREELRYRKLVGKENT